MANLLPNPEFETNTTGWIGSGTPATVTRSSTWAKTGSWSLRVVNTAADDGALTTPWNNVPVAGSTAYQFSGWIYADSSCEVDVGWNEYDSGGGYLTTQHSNANFFPTGSVAYFIQETYPATQATTAYLEVFVSIRNSSIDFYLDTLYLGSPITITLDDCKPDADITTTGWTTTPLWSKLNDASDATLITATGA